MASFEVIGDAPAQPSVTVELKCIIIQRSECLFDKQNRLDILMIENQLPYVKIKSLLFTRTGSLSYKRRVDLKSLRWNVAETDIARVCRVMCP